MAAKAAADIFGVMSHTFPEYWDHCLLVVSEVALCRNFSHSHDLHTFKTRTLSQTTRIGYARLLESERYCDYFRSRLLAVRLLAPWVTGAARAKVFTSKIVNLAIWNRIDA